MKDVYYIEHVVSPKGVHRLQRKWKSVISSSFDMTVLISTAISLKLKEFYHSKGAALTQKLTRVNIRLICWNCVEEMAGTVWKYGSQRALAFKSVCACERMDFKSERS